CQSPTGLPPSALTPHIAGPTCGMTKRSRWIAGLAFGLLGAALAVGALNSRSERPDVQILVTGYTSWPALSEGCAQDIHASSGLQKKATLLVTNCGRAPVRVLPFCDARVRSNKGE